MARFHIKREKWGGWAEQRELHSIVETIFGPYLRRAGLAIVRTEMQHTPVVSGHLRRGWALGEIKWEGKLIKIRIGNAVIYARRVNRTSTKSKGYVEKGLEDGRADAERIMREGLKALAPALWRAK